MRFDPATACDITRSLSDNFKIRADRNVRERVKIARKLRKTIARRADHIAKVIVEETSRPYAEALAQEVLPALEMSSYCEKMFPKWLAPVNLRYPRPGFFNKKNIIEWDPIGLVAVITPANFPFSLGMMSLTWLLLAGNTVVIKPSEKSSLVAPLITELLAETGIRGEFADTLYGGPEASQWLINEETVRKIFFFGSSTNGDQVAKQCHAVGKPYVLELGGGTTVIVLNDANVDDAVRGIAWSACYAHGEACIAANRIVVESGIADEFIEALKNYLKDLPSSDIPESTTDPLTMVITVDNAESSISDLDGTDPLGISIWSKDLSRAQNLARSIPVTMSWINDISVGLPCLPWGGRGTAGSGTIFSEYSLHEACNVRWTSIQSASPSKPRTWWYPYTKAKENLLKLAVKFFR